MRAFFAGVMNQAAKSGTGDATDILRRQIVADSVDSRPEFCLLGADYENSNLGIRALTTGALVAIYAQYPNASVWLLEYGNAPRRLVFDLPQKKVTVEMLNIRFSKRLWLKNHIARLVMTALLLLLIPARALRWKLASRNPWLRVIIRADRVLSLNYGDSFSDIYGLKRLLYVSLPQVLALLLKKQVVQLPQTIGPFNLRISRLVAKWILSRSALVYSRDEAAVSAIRGLIPKIHAGRVRFCHDLGFVVPPKPFAPPDLPLENVFSRRPVVGFNVSGLLWMGGYTHDNMFGLATDYKTLVRKAVTYLIETKGATVLLVPHVLSSGGEGDPIACEALFSEFHQDFPDRVFNLRPPYDEREVKHVIARCDFFVGARMHACIAALSQCVPATAMAYSSKFIGVLQSVGMQASVADLRSLSIDRALGVLGSSYDAREALKEVLISRICMVRRTVCNMSAELNDDIQGLFPDSNAGR